ncbi:MAG: hypothetical protein SCH72_06365 [Desulfuromonadales bacterium]|nr:hypothetical protein [Desulfuromonadales bacterium]
MSIYKIVKPTGQFELLPVKTLRDPRLQLDELGLLVRLISRPPGWEFRPGQIKKETGWGKDRLGRAMENLERAGYVKRRQIRLQNGGWNWVSEIYGESQNVDFYAERRRGKEKKKEEKPMIGLPGDGGSTGDGSPGDGSPGDGSPPHIYSTDLIQHRTETNQNTTTTKEGGEKETGEGDERSGGGGLDSYQSQPFPTPGGGASKDEEIKEYLRLGLLYGSAGGPPFSPTGWARKAKNRIIIDQGGLSEEDRGQMAGWKRKEEQEQGGEGPQPFETFMELYEKGEIR